MVDSRRLQPTFFRVRVSRRPDETLWIFPGRVPPGTVQEPGEMPLKRAPHVQVALVAVLAALVLLLSISCSSDRPEGQAGDDQRAGDARPGATGEPSEGAGQPDPRSSLVPVAHLTSLKESVSMEELSQAGELAVPRGYGGLAEELLDRQGFESMDSAEA